MKKDMIVISSSLCTFSVKPEEEGVGLHSKDTMIGKKYQNSVPWGHGILINV